MRTTSRPGWAVALALAVALLGALAIPAWAGGPTSDESRLLSLTNTARAATGAPALALDNGLSSIARQWAASMAAQGTMAHNPGLKDQIAAIGLDWTKTGENVGFGPTVASIHQALLDSPGHYRNIVDPDFQRVGIGIVVAANTVWIVEDFLAPAGAPRATPVPVPTPPALVVTTTVPPTTVPATTVPTTTAVPPTTVPAGQGLPLSLTLMLQQMRTLAARQ